MNKRMAAWLMAIALLSGMAGMAEEEAATPDEPLLTNPRERYEMYTETTDGSDQLLFAMLDGVNDEETIIADTGSITVYCDMLDDKGDVQVTMIQGLTIADGVKLLRISYIAAEQYMGEALDSVNIYVTQDTLYMIENGSLTTKPSTIAPEDYLSTWSAYYFPYTAIDVLHGVRQTDGGFTYFLASDKLGDLYEYVTNGLRIIDTRIYTPDGEGGYWLYMRLRYAFGEEPELPDMIKQALGEKQPEKQPDINMS